MGTLCFVALTMGSSVAANSCGVFSLLGAAEGTRMFVTAPGVLLTDAEGGMPATQAVSDSTLGNSSWGGAPYSPQAAGNLALIVGRIGLEDVSANDVPVFASSQHPTMPETTKTTPAGTIEARSDESSASGRVVTGGDENVPASIVEADTSCDEDGTARASARSIVRGFGVGPLVVGSVISEVEAVKSPDGTVTLEGSMLVSGVTVEGVPIGGVTDAVSVPADDLAALEQAGIFVRALDVVKDDDTGEVRAPGLEIVVVQQVDVGYGEVRTTVQIGAAIARASGRAIPQRPTVESEPIAIAPVSSPTTAGGDVSAPPAAEPPKLGPAPVEVEPPAASPTPTAPVASTGPLDEVPVVSSLLLGSSLGSLYASVAAGMLFMLVSWGISEARPWKVKWR